MANALRRWTRLLPLLAVLPGTAAALEPLDRFNVSVGSYVTRFDTRLRADGEVADGTRFDLYKDLGLDPEEALAFARVAWRPFDRHEFGLSYFHNDVGNEHRLEHDSCSRTPCTRPARPSAPATTWTASRPITCGGGCRPRAGRWGRGWA